MHTDLGDELVLIHGLTGHSYRLNATARVAWLNLPTSAQALGEVLAKKFEVDSSRAHRDALGVLETFVAQGLVNMQSAYPHTENPDQTLHS